MDLLGEQNRVSPTFLVEWDWCRKCSQLQISEHISDLRVSEAIPWAGEAGPLSLNESGFRRAESGDETAIRDCD
jgi:hypothetical protein